MKNHYEVRGDLTVIFLRCSRFKTWHECQIDTADLPTLMAINNTWSAHLARKSLTKRYALGKIYDAGVSRCFTVLMHRVLCGSKEGCELHHKDNDGLNNRRGNLEQLSHRENMRERKPSKNWQELDRRRVIADEYRLERDIARKVQADFNLCRQALWKIRSRRTRGSIGSARFAYLDVCQAAGVRTLDQLALVQKVQPGFKFGAMRAKGLPKL
jgi:hypothetical protein